MLYRYIASPLGNLLLGGDGAGLRLLCFPSGSKKQTPAAHWQEVPDCFPEAATQLREYFAGDRKHFELRLKPRVSPFQARVLESLQTIPYGETRTYGQIAKQIGQPRSVRAVGGANSRNPLPIFIPCHRVIGSAGKLTGFGGGLPAKRFLLDLESERARLF